MSLHHTGTAPKPKSEHQATVRKPQPHWGDLIPKASTPASFPRAVWGMCEEVTKPHKPG